MKKVFFSGLLITSLLTSCNPKSKDDSTHDSNAKDNDTTMTTADTTKTETQGADSKLYSCPMHPEVQGKLDDKCSKCGMKLTEPVK